MLGRDIKTTRAALLKGVKNLRSQVQSNIRTSLSLWPQVCRAACQACAEVFLSLGKAMEAEDRAGMGNLNLRESLGLSRNTTNNEQKTYQGDTGRTSSGLDVVSLASTLASDLAHLVESMNLADRPVATNQTNANKGGRGGRPLTARAMGQEGGRFSKLDMSAAELSSELNLAFGDSVGTTPTPPPTCQVTFPFVDFIGV